MLFFVCVVMAWVGLTGCENGGAHHRFPTGKYEISQVSVGGDELYIVFVRNADGSYSQRHIFTGETIVKFFYDVPEGESAFMQTTANEERDNSYKTVEFHLHGGQLIGGSTYRSGKRNTTVTPIVPGQNATLNDSAMNPSARSSGENAYACTQTDFDCPIRK